MGYSIVRKTDTILSKEKDVVVCLPGAGIEHVTQRVEPIMRRGNGGSILIHIGTNNADNEGTTAIVDKYRSLRRKTKQARVGQMIVSGILPVFVNRIRWYRISKRMAVNGMAKRLCKEEEVGYVDLWDSFVGREEMYVRGGLHHAIAAEMYKYCGINLTKSLVKLFNNYIWDSRAVPQEFKDATIVHVYKRKGDKSICDNHLGIYFLCIAGKIL